MPKSKTKLPVEGGLALVDKEALEKHQEEEAKKGEKISQSLATKIREPKPRSEKQIDHYKKLADFNKTPEGKQKMAEGREKKKAEKEKKQMQEEQEALKKMKEEGTIPEGKAIAEVAPQSKRGRPKASIKPYKPSTVPENEPAPLSAKVLDSDDSEDSDVEVEQPKTARPTAKTPRPYRKRKVNSSDSETPGSEDTDFDSKMKEREKKKKTKIAELESAIKQQEQKLEAISKQKPAKPVSRTDADLPVEEKDDKPTFDPKYKW